MRGGDLHFYFRSLFYPRSFGSVLGTTKQGREQVQAVSPQLRASGEPGMGGGKRSQKAPWFRALLGWRESMPLAQAKRKEALPTRREGRKTVAARKGAGRHRWMLPASPLLCPARIHSGFKGRGREDKTLAGSGMRAEGV